MGQDAVCRVRALGVVISQPLADARLCFRALLKGVQVNAFVLQKPPQMLDHAVVDPPPFAVHADFDPGCAQHVDPGTAGEPAALIRVNRPGFTGELLVQYFRLLFRLRSRFDRNFPLLLLG